MALFKYVEVFPDGSRKKSTMDISSERRLKSIVAARGNYALNVSEAGVANMEVDFSRVKAKDLCVFCEQMGSIVKAGVPLVDALEMTVKTTQKKKLRTAMQEIVVKVKEGNTFSSAMMDYPEIFPLIMTQLVKAGEQSGSLDIIFERLAKQFEKSYKLQSTIKKALAYPKMVVAVILAALVVICVVVIPQFVEVFEELQTPLPITTKFFIALSKLFTSYWWAGLLGVALIIVSWLMFSRSEWGKYKLCELKLKIPLVENLERKTASANFARTLSTLLSSGMDYPESLAIASDTMSNLLFKDAVLNIKTAVEDGDTLTTALKASNMFPELLENLLQIGENTGNIEEMLANSAVYFEDEVETATVKLTEAINPVIMIVVGIIVGVLVYSVYSPMFSIYDAIGNS